LKLSVKTRMVDKDYVETCLAKDGIVKLWLFDEEQLNDLLSFHDEQKPGYSSGFYATSFSSDFHYRKRVNEKIKQALGPQLKSVLPGYRIVFCNFLVKENRADSQVPVHQDWTFVNENEEVSLNVWCPLVETNALNGELQVFKGSHNLLEVIRAPFLPNPFMAEERLIRERYLTSCPTQLGEVLIYDHRLVHYSAPNMSKHPRQVANLSMVPVDSDLFYHYLDDSDGQQTLQKYQVTDEFFLTHRIGSRPKECKELGTVQFPAGNFMGERDLRCLLESNMRYA